jgi:hypothetical protein
VGTFWKVLTIILLVTYMSGALLNISMYWWPNIPTYPRPAEGRIYPLNNHGHYTYMNEREYRFQETTGLILPAVLLSLFLINYFIDPFDEKRKRRYGSPPAGFR